MPIAHFDCHRRHGANNVSWLLVYNRGTSPYFDYETWFSKISIQGHFKEVEFHKIAGYREKVVYVDESNTIFVQFNMYPKPP